MPSLVNTVVYYFNSIGQYKPVILQQWEHIIWNTDQIDFFVDAEPFSQITEHNRAIFLELEVTWHVVSA